MGFSSTKGQVTSNVDHLIWPNLKFIHDLIPIIFICNCYNDLIKKKKKNYILNAWCNPRNLLLRLSIPTCWWVKIKYLPRGQKSTGQMLNTILLMCFYQMPGQEPTARLYTPKLRAKLGARKTGLSPPVFLYWPFQGGTSVMVPYCSCCLYLYFGSAVVLVTYFVNFR